MSIHNQTLFRDTGILHSEDASVVLVYTEWNEQITSELVRGCEKKLVDYRVKKISKVQVPGAFELPFACKAYYETAPAKPDVIIAFGCIIRGDTPHFDYVCQSVTAGITQLNLSLPVPVIFGVLTVNNLRQAQERIGGKHGHKGQEAAITALKMAALIKKCKNQS